MKLGKWLIVEDVVFVLSIVSLLFGLAYYEVTRSPVGATFFWVGLTVAMIYLIRINIQAIRDKPEE